MALSKTPKIYIARHHGLVGSAIQKNLEARGYNQLVGRSHSELGSTNQQAVDDFFEKERPDVAALVAASVEDIMANNLYRADFTMQSTMMQCNVVSPAHKYGVRKLLFLGSTCIYPESTPQPMKGDVLPTSSLKYTDEEYATAKIAGLKMYENYNPQYGTNCIAMMPTDLYGPSDNFRLENSRVVSAMMRKIYLTKLIHEDDWEAVRVDMNKRPISPIKALIEQIGKDNVDDERSKEQILQTLKFYSIEDNKVTLWGTSSPLRELLWSEDTANASIHILPNVGFKDIIGIGKYSSMFCGTTTDGEVNRSNSEGRGGAIPSLGGIRNCYINIGVGKELTINQLSELIIRTVGSTRTIVWDESKPDGTPCKLIDVSKPHPLGWTHKAEIGGGMQRLHDQYKQLLQGQNATRFLLYSIIGLALWNLSKLKAINQLEIQS